MCIWRCNKHHISSHEQVCERNSAILVQMKLLCAAASKTRYNYQWLLNYNLQPTFWYCGLFQSSYIAKALTKCQFRLSSLKCVTRNYISLKTMVWICSVLNSICISVLSTSSPWFFFTETSHNIRLIFEYLTSSWCKILSMMLILLILNLYHTFAQTCTQETSLCLQNL